MFCRNCGTQIPESSKFCPNCGTSCSVEEQVKSAVEGVFQSTEQEMESAVRDMHETFSGNVGNQYNQNDGNGGTQYNQQYAGNDGPQYNQQYTGNGGPQYNQQYAGNGGPSYNQYGGYAGERLTDNRGLLSYILLSMITCGIYSYYFIYKMAHDVNIACEGDGENTSGLAAFICLSIITCGIYSWVWYYQLGNRLASNAPRYGLAFQENGTTVLMWLLFGALLCGIGPFVAMNILIKNSNRICYAYNQTHGFNSNVY